MSRILRPAGAATAALAIGLVLGACGGSPSTSPASSSPATTGTATASGPAPASTSPTGPAVSTQNPADYTLPSGLVPLYPFATTAQVLAWVASYQSGGHQPWHLDVRLTALAFTQGYLGYADVGRTGSDRNDSQGAHLQVGYSLPNGHLGVSAVVHLVRFGTGQDAPWEVVGTDDTSFSLENPVYDTTATTPVQVGGHITGVDENIRVIVRRLGTASPVGTFCCLAAGGSGSPWSANVTFHAAPGQVLTIAAATGGHTAAVERFAITGITVG